ncbi:MAG: hypothetical protein FWD97_01455 [Defluviitaleaceae bacterium]|nr:hypothetical protein [Defluviitaleaceae bacterium]
MHPFIFGNYTQFDTKLGRGWHCQSRVCWHFSSGSDVIVCISGAGNASPYQIVV